MGKGEIRPRETPQAFSSIYPKTRICLFYYIMPLTNTSDVNRGAIPDHLSLKKFNLELWLISLLGIIECSNPNPYDDFLACLTGLFRLLQLRM